MSDGPRRALVVAGALACLAVANPPVALAQAGGSIIGAFAGANTTEQEWSPDADVERVTGFTLGAFVEAVTPLSGFTVLAEGAFAQRGGDVVNAGTASVEGAVRTDYLSVSVRAKATVDAGPARAHLAAGPVFENVLRSRVSPGFQSILEREGRSAFGILMGAGVDVGIGQGRRIGVEARLFDGLSDAYSGDFISVRNRSWEAVVRFGIPMGQ